MKNSTTIKDCENHIKNYIEKSNFYSDNNDNKKNKNQYYYTEKVNNNNYKSFYVVHLIVAQENTEAGNYYNKTTFDFLKTQLKADLKRKRNFNIIEDFRQSLALFSQQFFENRINLNELEIKDNKIIYNCKKENRLNKWKTNEIGIPDFYDNIYKTNYSCERKEFKENDKIIHMIKFIIEIPGRVNSDFKNQNNDFIAKIIRKKFTYYFEFSGFFLWIHIMTMLFYYMIKFM